MIQIIVHAQILITVILKKRKLHNKIQYAAISFTNGKVNDSSDKMYLDHSNTLLVFFNKHKTNKIHR